MYVCVYVGVRTTVWGFLKSHSSSLLLATVCYLHIEFEFEEEVERKQKPEDVETDGSHADGFQYGEWAQMTFIST